MAVSTFSAGMSSTCLWNSKGREVPECMKHLAENNKKKTNVPPSHHARKWISNALNHSNRNMLVPPLEPHSALQPSPLWGQGWITSVGMNAGTDSFLPPKCTWSNLAEWMCWMSEFFIWNWSWSAFKLGGISYLCFCLYLLRTACSFEELGRRKTWMCSHGLKDTKKIWFFLEYVFDH